MSLVDYTIAVRRRPQWRRVRLQPGLWLAWAVMIAALLMAIAPQWFTSANPLEGIPGAQRLAPQAHYWLGTDQLGRDLWTRVVYGAVHSLSAALIAVAIGLVVGTALGTLAGALAGRVESTIMRLVDVLLAIPSLLLQLTVIILLGFGTVNAAVAVGIAAIASFARLARAEVVRVRHSDYVEAARGSGGTFFRRLLAPYSAQLAHCGACFRDAAVRSGDVGPGHPQLPRLRHSAAGPGVGTTDRRRSQLPVNRLVADHLPRPRRGRRGPCRQSS